MHTQTTGSFTSKFQEYIWNRRALANGSPAVGQERLAGGHGAKGSMSWAASWERLQLDVPV